MAFLSGLGRTLGRIGNNVPMAQAALAGDYGGMASMRAQQERQRLLEEQAEREAQARATQMELAAQLTNPDGTPLLSKAQIGGMNANDLSQRIREAGTPWRVDAGGGAERDPNTGAWSIAPSERQVGRTIVRTAPDGTANPVFRGVEPVVVPEVGVYGWDDRGPVTPGGQGQQQQPPGIVPTPWPGSQPGANIPSGNPLDPNLGQPRAQPTAAFNADGIFDRMIHAESRGQQFGRDGQPLRSRAGALGIAQVMPGTAPEAARLAGIPYDENRYRNDPQYNAALGRAYFNEQLRTFQDPALAVAAYNAGPGRVQSALQRGGANWQAHIPRETRDYLVNVLGENAPGARTAAYQPSGVRSDMPQPMIPTGPRPQRPPAQTPAQQRLDQLNVQQREREVSRTPGQEAVDRAFGERYADWRTNGFADAQRNLEQLRGTIDSVRNYNVTGGVLGRLPEFMVNDRVTDTREQVEEVVQRNLRIVLGAQFTAQEGERLIARAYNPRLDESVNATRLERLYRQMGRAAQAQEQAARYFEENGTLRGWRGRLWGINDFNPDRPDPNEGRRQQQPTQNSRGRTGNGVRYRRVGQ